MADVGRMTGAAQNIALLLVIVCTSAFAADNFIVTHAPSYLQFLPTGKQLPLSQIPDLLTTTYGFSPSHEVSWDGLSQGSLFHRPKANVIFSFDGFKDAHTLANTKHIAKYDTHNKFVPKDAMDSELALVKVMAWCQIGDKPLQEPVTIPFSDVFVKHEAADAYFVNTEKVSNRLQSSVTAPLIIDFSASNSVFDIKAHYPELFSRLPGNPDDVTDIFARGEHALGRYNLGSLNVTRPSDLILLAELELIQEMIDALKEDSSSLRDNQPDLFHFRLGGFQMLVESYPAGSQALTDATNLLQDFINQATEDFKALYNGNVMVEVITMSGNVHKVVRKGRSLLQAEDTSIKQQLNLAADYSNDYPVAFNIILWTVVVMGLTVLGVSVGLWNMDPGRDSIIYRMTSQRMKKD